MSLYAFHAFLITTAIVFFAGFGVYCFQDGAADGGSVYPVMGTASGVVVVLLAGYLVYFISYRLRRQTGQAGSGM